MPDTGTAIAERPAGQVVQHDTRGAEERVVMDLLNRSDLPVERIDGFLARLDVIRERNEAAIYNDAMRQVKAQLPVVGRTVTNTHVSKKYADLADIALACDAIIAENGFSTEFWPFNSEKPDHLGIGCTVSHASGHQRTFKADVPLDSAGAKGTANKPAIHAWKSTMTYGRRTLKEAIFDIATADDDGNGAAGVSNGPANESQIKVFTDLVEKHEAHLGKLLKAVHAETIDSMSTKQLADATDKLMAWVATKPQKAAAQ